MLNRLAAEQRPRFVKTHLPLDGLPYHDDVLETRWPAVVQACRFETVKKNPEKVVGDMSISFKGGAQTFINKGTNGRWREVLTAADLELYEAANARVLPDDCAAWVEGGWLAA